MGTTIDGGERVDLRPGDPVVTTDARGTAAPSPAKDRLLLPLLVPLLSVIAVGLLAVNISRVFLAGTSAAALISAVVITVAILGGASVVSAAPRLRTSSLAMLGGLAFVIVVSAGLLALGPSIEHDSGPEGYVPPAGRAVGTLSIIATPGLTFDGVADNTYTVPEAGVVAIELGGESGHTLAFREPALAGFLLQSPPGAPHRGRVELAAGTYDIYCTVGTHAASGIQATLTVG